MSHLARWAFSPLDCQVHVLAGHDRPALTAVFGCPAFTAVDRAISTLTSPRRDWALGLMVGVGGLMLRVVNSRAGFVPR